MFHTRYTRGRPAAPAWNPSMPTYICEYRYKDKTFHKIKNWTSCLPEEVRAVPEQLVPFAIAQKMPPRVKSPFVAGQAVDSANATNVKQEVTVRFSISVKTNRLSSNSTNLARMLPSRSPFRPFRSLAMRPLVAQKNVSTNLSTLLRITISSTRFQKRYVRLPF
jgi:hypothetical protein